MVEWGALKNIPNMEEWENLGTSLGTDYLLGLNHEAGDYDLIPKEIQQEIHDFAKTKFLPALLVYIEKHDLPIGGISLSNFHLIAGGDFLKPIFNNEQRYDLSNLDDLKIMPVNYYYKLDGKQLIGSAIRICEAIGRPEYAEAFNKIVEGCFTPHKTQDETDIVRISFGLTVKPSTGKLQCNCH